VVRERAVAGRAPDALQSPGVRASASCASAAVRATRISSPGVKNVSSPGQSSLSTGVPHAAASNSLPEGHQPMAAIGARVTLSVNAEEQ